MKNIVVFVLVVLSMQGLISRSLSAEQSIESEYRNLESRIKAKLDEGKRTEQELAPELQEFDAFIERYKVLKTDEVAEYLVMEANLYLQVFDNTVKGAELIKRLQRDFPDTQLGENAYKMLEAIKRQEAARKTRQALQIGTKFPDFVGQDLAGNPLALKNLKAKVVLIDFWATWCDLWTNNLPQLQNLYEKFHTNGFEIIGVSMDDDTKNLTAYTQLKKMSWPQYFDKQGWQNKVALRCGINRIPYSFLLDGEGTIIGTNLHGDNLNQAITKAIAK